MKFSPFMLSTLALVAMGGARQSELSIASMPLLPRAGKYQGSSMPEKDGIVTSSDGRRYQRQPDGSLRRIKG
jgi:hypothetical protein